MACQTWFSKLVGRKAHLFRKLIVLSLQLACAFSLVRHVVVRWGFRHQLARPKGTRGAPRSFSMDFAWILHPFFMILDPSRSFVMILPRFRHRVFASFSQDAKNRQEPAKNQAHNGLLKT
jgi:hypothetical protein